MVPPKNFGDLCSRHLLHSSVRNLKTYNEHIGTLWNIYPSSINSPWHNNRWTWQTDFIFKFEFQNNILIHSMSYCLQQSTKSLHSRHLRSYRPICCLQMKVYLGLLHPRPMHWHHRTPSALKVLVFWGKISSLECQDSGNLLPMSYCTYFQYGTLAVVLCHSTAVRLQRNHRHLVLNIQTGNDVIPYKNDFKHMNTAKHRKLGPLRILRIQRYMILRMARVVATKNF